MARWNLALLAALAFGAAPAAQHKAEQRDMALVGYNDLQARSAYQPTIHRQGNRWIAYIGHHGGVQRNPITGMDEQNGTSIVDVTDPKRPRYLAHIPGEARRGRGRRRADGARLQRQHAAPRRQEQGLPAALVRQLGSRDLGRHRSRQAVAPARAGRGSTKHAQELLGMRHRHRLCHLRPERLAHAPDDEDLRPERSGQAGVHPRLRSAWPAARIDRDADTDRAARPDLPRPEGQSRLLRLRHEPRRRRADRRSDRSS